jgi:hypothetical protein
VQLRPWRITAWWVKACYIASAYLFVWGLEEVLRGLGLAPVAVLLASTPLVVVAFLVGARVFRVSGERSEPRPWWQFTGRPRLGFVIGWVTVGMIALSIAYLPLTVSEFGLAFEILSIAFLVIMSGTYLHSSIRLRERLRQQYSPASLGEDPSQ